jgi:hypothetical protein
MHRRPGKWLRMVIVTHYDQYFTPYLNEFIREANFVRYAYMPHQTMLEQFTLRINKTVRENFGLYYPEEEIY